MSLYGLIAPILRTPDYQSLVNDVREQSADLSKGLGLLRAARPLLITALQKELRCPIVYLVSTVEGSRTSFDALRSLALTGNAAAAPYSSILRSVEPNTAFYDTVAPVVDIIVQRSTVLASLYLSSHSDSDRADYPLVISSPRALMHPSLSMAQFKTATRVLRRDQMITLEPTLAGWVAGGYMNESVVERVGAFSRRGGIIDVWPPAHPLPVRIELFGSQIESIRQFDPGTQRSGEMLERLIITPFENAAGSQDVEGVSGDRAKMYTTVLDYLGPDGLLIIDDEMELHDAWVALEAKAERDRETMIPLDEDADAATEEGANKPPNKLPAPSNDPPAPYVTWEAYMANRKRLPRTLILGQADNAMAMARHPLAAHFSVSMHFAGQLSPVMEYLRASTAPAADIPGGHATVVLSRQAPRLAEMWSERNSAIAPQTALDESPAGALTFVTGALPEGFVFSESRDARYEDSPANPQSPLANLTLLTDAELFGYVRPDAWQYGKGRKPAPERAFADWQPGDVVVHEDYGIGIFRGLARLTVNTGTPMEPVEGEREYLLLEYADADRRYVPLHQLDRISRYVGSEDSRPTLSKLGTAEWAQAKQKARGAAAQVARDMLKLYAAREMAKGVAFSKDSTWQAELEASFPYVETEDQLRAILEVKQDLERAKPMDRLVCGDVGFGKTEVALRAAFKAVMEHYQVAVLVPTTVLAQQHWLTFTRRLASYPVRIEMLSRFRTAAEKRKALEGMRDGHVDIVIGTHALLAGNVQFANLGLLIIDEEQRFGVTAKEKLKQMRTNVHVMTLTATPIPRTLYFGLAGIRDVSRIETPPAERLPIISYVGAFDDLVVKQAIQRELDREGQIFFVHNRISTIHLLETKLRRLAPEATIAVAHGQMEDRALARIMNEFADGKTNILLSTNIVESGLDIPNANTIIIDRADHFGLADLYQLRGRVGRSTTQAYAYFLYDRRSQMTPEARERLETLREAAGIGAGYMIAMRDLELRGTGDILGPRQSGQIASIGLDLYTRLLAREVTTLRALRDGATPPEPEPSPVTIDLPLTVGLPQNYIGDQPLRLQMYRRVASLDNEEKIRLFEEELEDRFGKLPQSALNLTYQARLKCWAIVFEAQSITSEGNRFVIRADSIEKLGRNALVRLLGEDATIGRRQVSFLRNGPPEIWKARLMLICEKLAEMNSVVSTYNHEHA
jgi:transcription-repair coupling factor (superfamily II helicase)